MNRDTEADDSDAEYAFRRRQILAARDASGVTSDGGLRPADALARMQRDVLNPALAAPRGTVWATPAASVALRTPAFEQALASIRLLHALLAGPQRVGSPFQRTVLAAAARPPWPATTERTVPWTMRAAVEHWERELGCAFVLAYVYPAPQANTALLFEWQADEAGSPDAACLVVLCAPLVAAGTRAAIFMRMDLYDVDVQWPEGAALREDESGIVAAWRTPLSYVTAAFADSALSFISQQ